MQKTTDKTLRHIHADYMHKKLQMKPAENRP